MLQRIQSHMHPLYVWDASCANLSGRYNRKGGAAALIYLFSGVIRGITCYLPLPSILPITPSKEDKTQKEAKA